ncbi:MAG: CPBP family intramembrane glutamic endopeptidase, partial [Terriglobia bacterium]
MLAREAVVFGIALLATAIMGIIEKRPFGTYLLPLRSAFKGNFWWGALWGGAAITALLVPLRLDHGFSFGPLALGGWKVAGDAALWALVFTAVGLSEEFTFRGYALYTLTRGMGFWPAALVLSGAFGAVHLGNPGEDWVGALSAALIGLFFCFTVRRTGTLWLAAGLHAAWDYAETFVYSVPNSGLVARGHLLKSSFHGPAWLTGGSVGPEGSVFVFAVIAALFVALQLCYPRARFPEPRL